MNRGYHSWVTTGENHLNILLREMRICHCKFFLLLGEGNLHGGGGRDLEALESVARRRGLQLVLKLHERDVVPSRY